MTTRTCSCALQISGYLVLNPHISRPVGRPLLHGSRYHALPDGGCWKAGVCAAEAGWQLAMFACGEGTRATSRCRRSRLTAGLEMLDVAVRMGSRAAWRRSYKVIGEWVHTGVGLGHGSGSAYASVGVTPSRVDVKNVLASTAPRTAPTRRNGSRQLQPRFAWFVGGTG